MSSGKRVKEPVLRELVTADSVTAIRAIGQLGGFALGITYGGNERWLETVRGDVRLFSNLTTLAAFLRKMGVPCFQVDTTEYKAGRLRPARPDRADALRRSRTRPRQTSLELASRQS